MLLQAFTEDSATISADSLFAQFVDHSTANNPHIYCGTTSIRTVVNSQGSQWWTKKERRSLLAASMSVTSLR